MSLNLKTLTAYLDSYSPPVDFAPPGYGVIKLETLRALIGALREARGALGAFAMIAPLYDGELDHAHVAGRIRENATQSVLVEDFRRARNVLASVSDD